MIFLPRRSSRPRLSDSESSTQHHRPHTPSPTTTTRLIKRVSTIFSPRKKSVLPPHLQPLGNVAAAGRRRYSSHTVSPSSSIDDIRPPSGLGRVCVVRSNSLSSEKPLPSLPRESLTGTFQRSRSLSSPGLLRFNVRRKEPPPWIDSLTTNNRVPIITNHDDIDSAIITITPAPSPPPHTPTIQPFAFHFPPEVLAVLLSFLARADVAPLGTVSRAFCAAVRKNLYTTIDLRTIPSPARVDRLTAVLASRWDLAESVHTLVCHHWPPPSSTPTPTLPFCLFTSPAPTTTATSSVFSAALRNAHHLTALTLPAFDPAVVPDGRRAAFRLRHLTLLCTTMSAHERAQLFDWLATQPDIRSLSFPNLIEHLDTANGAVPAAAEANGVSTAPPYDFLDFAPVSSLVSSGTTDHSLLLTTPSSSSLHLPLPSTPTGTIPPTLLPHLTALHAPPALTTLLARTRPLTHVTTHIHTNLDTGLRPAALLAAIPGATALDVRFGARVDRRSVEKVLRAAARVLGAVCERLDVWVGAIVSDECLYKIVHIVIPRFIVLHTLTLRRSVPLSQTQTPMQTPTQTPTRTPTQENVTYLTHAPDHLHEDEDAHLESWLKHCPALRSVTFLSHAEWASEP